MRRSKMKPGWMSPGYWRTVPSVAPRQAISCTPSSGLIEVSFSSPSLGNPAGAAQYCGGPLPRNGGAGGWLVSAALRHTWERRASLPWSAVAGSAYASAAVGLAERLGIRCWPLTGNLQALALALAAEMARPCRWSMRNWPGSRGTVAKDTTLGDVLRPFPGNWTGSEFRWSTTAWFWPPPECLHGRLTKSSPWKSAGPIAPSASPSRPACPLPASTTCRLVRSVLEVATPAVKAAWLLEDLLNTARAVPTAAIAGLDQDPDAWRGVPRKNTDICWNQLGCAKGSRARGRVVPQRAGARRLVPS